MDLWKFENALASQFVIARANELKNLHFEWILGVGVTQFVRFDLNCFKLILGDVGSSLVYFHPLHPRKVKVLDLSLLYEISGCVVKSNLQQPEKQFS